MSKTYKTQRAWAAYHTDFDSVAPGKQRLHAIKNVFRNIGERFGNQRKMRAKLKTIMRRLRRRRNNRFSVDTE